jgi:hypothetical protein
MAMGSPEWIEESLARLESMEQERDEHEKALESTADADALRMHSESIDRLDEEIKQLYAALEAVAEEGDDEEEEDDVDDVIRTSPFERDEPAAAPAPEPEPEPEPAPAAAPVEDLPDDPFAVPSAAAAAPAAAAPAAAPAFADPAPMAMDAGFDEPKGGGAGKWIVLVVLLVGGGAGGFFYWKNQQKAAAPPPAAPAEAKVIEATAVPDDTQGPRGAKGQEGVTKTPDRDLSKGGKRRGGGGGGGGGGSRGGGGGKSKGNGKAIELKAGDDPLG